VTAIAGHWSQSSEKGMALPGKRRARPHGCLHFLEQMCILHI
jgi:hypothetical protein